MRLNELAQQAHRIAKDKGWWETERNFGELCALIHSEVSEMFEAWRKDKPEQEIMTEAADIIIRLADLAESRQWDLEAAVAFKMAINENRPYRHGGLKA